MNVRITTIRNSDQEYPTVGDWRFDNNGDLDIYVSDYGNWRYEALVGIHELVEALLCKERGISQQSVDEFDKTHLDVEEPGFHRDAPYYDEHQVADVVERLMASQMGLNWDDYEESPVIDK